MFLSQAIYVLESLQLESAFEQYESLFLATHVPPFSEAAWHEGRICEPDYLPFFASPTLEEMLIDIAGRHAAKVTANSLRSLPFRRNGIGTKISR